MNKVHLKTLWLEGYTFVNHALYSSDCLYLSANISYL